MPSSSSPQVADSLKAFRYLSRSDVETVNLPMDTIVEVVERALLENAHGRALMPPKHWMELGNRWFGGMSSVVPAFDAAIIKWQSGSESNAERGLPYLTGMMFVNSLQTGLVEAVMDSTWLTQERTAAASAVTARHLAKPDTRVWSVLGCGVQAYSHLRALRLVLPALEEVVAYDINPAAAERFADHVKSEGFKCRIVDSARAAVEAGDVVVTSSRIEVNAARPIQPGWLRPGALAIPIDYDCYWSADALNDVDLLITDGIDQFEHLRGDGYFVGSPAPHAEIGAIAAGLVTGRTDDNQTILSVNIGVAVEDVATASAIVRAAYERNIGQMISR